MCEVEQIIQTIARIKTLAKDAPLEGVIVLMISDEDLEKLEILRSSMFGAISLIVVDDLRDDPSRKLPTHHKSSPYLLWHAAKISENESDIARFLAHCETAGHRPCISLSGGKISAGNELLLRESLEKPIITLKENVTCNNAVAAYRSLASSLSLAIYHFLFG